MKWLLIILLNFINPLPGEDGHSITKKGFNMQSDIYKVLSLNEWEHAQISGFITTELDKKDGFIHLSTSAQLNATLSLYFAKEESVMLLQVDHSQVNEKLKFEAPIPSGDRVGLFPHYYGNLNINAISKTWHLNRGAFEMPIEVMLQAEQSPNS